MIPITLDDNKLKDALKQAIRELIQEDQKMISNLIVEVIEDIAFEMRLKKEKPLKQLIEMKFLIF